MRNSVPEVFQPLMVLHFEKVDEAISPGLTVLRWNSVDVDSFVSHVYDALADLEKLIMRVSNILEVRVHAELAAISKSTLCKLPEGDPWTPEEFLQKTAVRILLLDVLSFNLSYYRNCVCIKRLI